MNSRNDGDRGRREHPPLGRSRRCTEPSPAFTLCLAGLGATMMLVGCGGGESSSPSSRAPLTETPPGTESVEMVDAPAVQMAAPGRFRASSTAETSGDQSHPEGTLSALARPSDTGTNTEHASVNVVGDLVADERAESHANRGEPGSPVGASASTGN